MVMISSMIATTAVAKERKQICDTCPQQNMIKICNSCGCIIPAKVWMRSSSCPDGKWAAVEDDGMMHVIDDTIWEKRDEI